MPDPWLMLQAIAAALIASAIAAAAGRSAGRRLSPASQGVAITIGAMAGLAVLGVRPRWPMTEDQDRFLGLVLPAIVLLETTLRSFKLPGTVQVVARIMAASAVAPAILFGSSYVADLTGPGSAAWPPAQRYGIFAGLGLALFGTWWALAWTSKRADSALRVPLSLSGAIAGAAICVMLSGYATGGMNGLPIAGATAGASIAATMLRGDDRDALPGVGLIALSGLLIVGCCFGELKVDTAAMLFLAPLLSALPEAPPLARLRPWARTALALTLVASATAATVGLTLHRFQVAESSKGADADDYYR